MSRLNVLTRRPLPSSARVSSNNQLNSQKQEEEKSKWVFVRRITVVGVPLLECLFGMLFKVCVLLWCEMCEAVVSDWNIFSPEDKKEKVQKDCTYLKGKKLTIVWKVSVIELHKTKVPAITWLVCGCDLPTIYRCDNFFYCDNILLWQLAVKSCSYAGTLKERRTVQ